ncbi:methylated-DNA--[protein]-cysteine S-methyltransferase [Ferruginibacter paludis]|uniref:methylated-DNA--[protein]-cysteine S-methyltransferase n=1 Tax=Ferruginibacter paludis TaxID=1310417 RepID=UPI0025B4B75D|nr:methylated-DNA--[protein]-cysteine S-methyltransferase [Ferruginibacter paludis]MDN3656304.1 methylated-DNA--[protein]-cysteine S-methyltransferase [Ferruginibacter paludis]
MTKISVYYDSPVGLILIEAVDDAITALLFKDEKDTGLFDGTAASDNELIVKCIRQLNEYFEGTRRQFDLPLQQNGTAFQQKIWSALIQIPYGQTISYMELSKRTGDPKAIRAVGTTNGKNQLSIVVPCHRVIGSNGTLTGYGGGLWRKRWLLEHEAKIAHGVKTLF